MLAPYYQPNTIECGCDEAGRGCLAGPVVAAAVILPVGFDLPELNDSKKLSETQRDTLAIAIKAQAITYAVGICSHTEIDKINILKASFEAMHRAVNQLSTLPQLLLIDGNRFTSHPLFSHVCIIKGDAKYASIAAASILAKTYRDMLMKQLHAEEPQYNWAQNKGYPTKAHRTAIEKHGVSAHHRRSFRLLDYKLF